MLLSEVFFVGVEATRLTWLARRISRMYWQEVPYRAFSVARGFAQSKGFFAAAVPPESVNPQFGAAWCTVPENRERDPQLEARAKRLFDGHLEVFGKRVNAPKGIPDWNADPVTNTRIESEFGLSIDFRHIGNGVDIKFLWEVNRHLWWVPLAQHYATSGDRRYLARIGELLSDWLRACPYALGPNWSSPVEHGIRLINWSLVWHLIGGAASPLFEGHKGRELLDRWLTSIYQHMRFASDNYSFYSSADNHLIGEAAGVFVAAHTWNQWSESRRLRGVAKAILERETLLQFNPEGVNLEQAICYHKFSLQFLLASGLCGRTNSDDFSPMFWSRIEAAVTFLAAMMDCQGQVPSIGDSDDGEVWRLDQGDSFNPHRSIVAVGAALFQRTDLQAKVESCGPEADGQIPWLVGLSPPNLGGATDEPLPSRFQEGGYLVLGTNLHSSSESRVTFDCGPLGYNRIAGHGHADALSVVLSLAGTPVLVDPGTYCYNAAPDFRHFFRGTHAHNTLVVDDCDQSEYGASFLWLREVNCTLINAPDELPQSVHACHDGYRRLADPVVHHRRVTIAEDGQSLVVQDWLDCAKSHDVELLWHGAAGCSIEHDAGDAWTLRLAERRVNLMVDGASLECAVIEGRDHPPQGWVSSKFYERTPAPVLSARTRLRPGQIVRTVISWESESLEAIPAAA